MPNERVSSDTAQLIVCGLAHIDASLARSRAGRLVSLINAQMMPSTPPGLAPERHLQLPMNDVAQPTAGLTMPNVGHVESLIDFVRAWDDDTPTIIHCWAGISRSTAGAFAVACALDPDRDEQEIATALRTASPTANPNRLLVQCADLVLERRGRMVAAIDRIGRGELAPSGQPFQFTISRRKG